MISGHNSNGRVPTKMQRNKAQTAKDNRAMGQWKPTDNPKAVTGKSQKSTIKNIKGTPKGKKGITSPVRLNKDI